MKNKFLMVIVVLVVTFFALYFVKKTKDPSDFVSPMTAYNATTTYSVINMSYPVSSNTKNQEIFNFVGKVRSDFETQFASVTPEQINEMYGRQDVQFQLVMNTKLATSTKTITYIIETYIYGGGAHGGTSVTTYTYDASGKLISLDDVFEGDYLAVISPKAREYAYKNFSDVSQPTMIDPGTAQNKDNFSSWYLLDDAVVFIFNQYQIGPYALGTQEFPLPKSQVSTIIKPTFK